MRTHTNDFKTNIKNLGREVAVRITYGNTTLDNEDINSANLNYNGDILKSVMKQLQLDSNIDIALETQISLEIGILVGNSYEYINYGSFIVNKSEKQENTNSYLLTCYDKMLYSMKPYEDLGVTYPVTIRSYISAICTKLGLTFASSSTNFVNYNKEIPNELYLDSQGNSLDYTFRDVLDQLAQVTASTICINDSGNLEIRYITNTNDTIDEEFLKNINVNFGELYGTINTITLSRSADSDSISKSIPETLPDEDKKEIKISDNQILNGNNRDEYIDGILNQLYGLSYYVNDFASTGILYYDLCDKYSITVGNNTYSCVMLNDEININNGIVENIHTNMPENSKTDYSKVDKTDRRINQTTLIVDKQQGQINAVVSQVETIQNDLQNPTQILTGEYFDIEDAIDEPLLDFKMYGDTSQSGTPTPSTPQDIHNVSGDNTIKICGKNLFDKDNLTELTAYFSDDGLINSSVSAKVLYIPCYGNTTYTISKVLSTRFRILTTSVLPAVGVRGTDYSYNDSGTSITITTSSTAKYLCVYYYYSTDTLTKQQVLNSIQIEFGSTTSQYESYTGNSQLISLGVENLFDKDNATYKNSKYINNNGYEVDSTISGYTTSFVTVTPNTTYTIQGKIRKDTSYNSSVYFYDTSKAFINRTAWGGANLNYFTFTTPNNCYYIRFQYAMEIYDATTVQIEKGSIASSYSEYGIVPIELNKINTYQDYIYKDNDRWYLHKKIDKIIFDGTEDWTASSTYLGSYYLSSSKTTLKPTYTFAQLFSDKFTRANIDSGSQISSNYQYGTCFIETPTGAFNCWWGDNTTTLNDFKTWLTNNNVILYYPLQNAEEIEITDTTLLEQLNRLMTLPLYKNMTHITLTPNDLQPTMEIEYLRDTSINENFVRQPQLNNYYTKVETTAQIQIGNSSIQQSVAEMQITLDSNGEVINTISNQVQTLQSSTSLQINAINTQLENGVEKLTNSLVTINTDGINTSKEGETFNTQITNKTFEVRDGTNELAFMGYDENEKRTIARIPTLESEQATIGVHRTEVITKNGEKRTAGFYVGGDN